MRFLITLFTATFLAAANDASARGIEPGQWRITTTMSSPILSGSQTATSTQCVTREDLKDPRRAIDKRLQSDCRTVSLVQDGNTYTWEVRCKVARMSNKGTLHHGRATMVGESRTTANVFGQKFDMRTKIIAKRLGPCA